VERRFVEKRVGKVHAEKIVGGPRVFKSNKVTDERGEVGTQKGSITIIIEWGI